MEAVISLLRSLELSVVKPLPALTALESDKKNMKLATGVRAYGNVKIMASRQSGC